MAVEKIATKTQGDYVIIDMSGGRVYSLSKPTLLDSRESLRRVCAEVDADPSVVIDRSLPGRREEPGKDATPITRFWQAADDQHIIAKSESSKKDLVLTAGELAALFDAFDLR